MGQEVGGNDLPAIFFISDLKAFIKEFLKFTQNKEELIEKSPNVHIPLLNLVFV